MFAGRIGEQVAPPLVTRSTTGRMGGEWGASPTTTTRPAQRNVLIQDGLLVDYMGRRAGPARSGRSSSGQRPAAGYQHLPMAWMTNTYLRTGGPPSPDDIVADTPSGVYVAHLGGQVNTC